MEQQPACAADIAFRVAEHTRSRSGGGGSESEPLLRRLYAVVRVADLSESPLLIDAAQCALLGNDDRAQCCMRIGASDTLLAQLCARPAIVQAMSIATLAAMLRGHVLSTRFQLVALLRAYLRERGDTLPADDVLEVVQAAPPLSGSALDVAVQLLVLCHRHGVLARAAQAVATCCVKPLLVDLSLGCVDAVAQLPVDVAVFVLQQQDGVGVRCSGNAIFRLAERMRAAAGGRGAEGGDATSALQQLYALVRPSELDVAQLIEACECPYMNERAVMRAITAMMARKLNMEVRCRVCTCSSGWLGVA
jgi:hypothetical protein